MSCELSLDDIVTEFLLSTCQLCPASRSPHAVVAALLCGGYATGRPNKDDPDVAYIPLTTGSVAEFYIAPILPLVGDIDVMFYCNIQLAIPRGHPPPTQLPDEFHNYVKVYEIIDSHLPGYVYLELRYLLTQCSDDDDYNAVEYDRGQYLLNQLLSAEKEIHGPALVYHIGDRRPGFVDRVLPIAKEKGEKKKLMSTKYKCCLQPSSLIAQLATLELSLTAG